MVKGACSVKKNHAADKYTHGKNNDGIIRVYCFADKWKSTDNCTDNSDLMSNGTAGIFKLFICFVHNEYLLS